MKTNLYVFSANIIINSCASSKFHVHEICFGRKNKPMRTKFAILKAPVRSTTTSAATARLGSRARQAKCES